MGTASSDGCPQGARRKSGEGPRKASRKSLRTAKGPKHLPSCWRASRRRTDTEPFAGHPREWTATRTTWSPRHAPSTLKTFATSIIRLQTDDLNGSARLGQRVSTSAPPPACPREKNMLSFSGRRPARNAAPTPRFRSRCSQQPPAELRPSLTARQVLATFTQGPGSQVLRALDELPTRQLVQRPR